MDESLEKHLAIPPRDQEFLNGVIAYFSREGMFYDPAQDVPRPRKGSIARVPWTPFSAVLYFTPVPVSAGLLLTRPKIQDATAVGFIKGPLDEKDLARAESYSETTEFAYRIKTCLSPVLPENDRLASLTERAARTFVPLLTGGLWRFDTSCSHLLDGAFLTEDEVARIAEYASTGFDAGMTLAQMRAHLDQIAYHALVYPDLETLK